MRKPRTKAERAEKLAHLLRKAERRIYRRDAIQIELKGGETFLELLWIMRRVTQAIELATNLHVATLIDRGISSE